MFPSKGSMSVSQATVMGGAATTATGVNVQLAPDSARVQSIAGSVSGLLVSMPDATQLPLGGVMFVIKNTGTFPLQARDFSGGLLALIRPSQVMMFYVTSASTQAGTWAVGNGSALASQDFGVGPMTVVTAATMAYATTLPMSNTTALFASANNTTTVSVYVLNISGGIITAGPVNNLTVTPNANMFKLAYIDATHALFSVHANGAGTHYSCVFTIGTTVTAGAYANLVYSSFVGSSLIRMSATQFVLTFGNVSSYPAAVTLNVSGTTVTYGTPMSMNSSVALGYTAVPATPISATQFIASYDNGASGSLATLCSISGTNITANSTVTVASASPYYTAIAASFNSTTALFLAGTSSLIYVSVLGVSGTTLSILDTQSYTVYPVVSGQQFPYLMSNACGLAAFPGNAYIFSYGEGNAPYAMKVQSFTVSGKTVTAGAPVQISPFTYTNGIFSLQSWADSSATSYWAIASSQNAVNYYGSAIVMEYIQP